MRKSVQSDPRYISQAWCQDNNIKISAYVTGVPKGWMKLQVEQGASVNLTDQFKVKEFSERYFALCLFFYNKYN